MIECEGDLFTSDQRALAHGVNCCGVMGAGIAKSFRTFYPVNYGVYRAQCMVKGLRPGGVLIVPEDDQDWDDGGERLIVNLATQNMPGPDARYEWLKSSVQFAVDQLLSLGVHSLALPQIGCGIGGLEWPRVKNFLLSEEEGVQPGNHFEFEVWTYKE